jgi:putative CocE/NonD family hydrolase
MSIEEENLCQVEEVEHQWILLADGTRLAARLWLPVLPRGVRAPAVLEYIPYRKRDMVRARDERNHPVFARHGYASLRVDMRGSGDSEGLMTDMYGTEELDDALEVIAWIARQPWCDGSVGMMGTSWGGTASLQAAARRPEPLKAIIAVCATNNRFDDDIHHMGGCLLTDTVEWGATLPTILAAPPDPKTVGDDWRRIWKQRLDGLAFPLENWIRHETRDAYWKWGSVNETPDAIACPVLAIGGWADRYSNTVMNLLSESHDRCWGIVGPWGHHYPDVAIPGPGIAFQAEALRWWDHWLKGQNNGIEQEPRLRVWLQDYAEPQDRIERRPGRWIGEANWPSGNVAARDFGLAPGRLLSGSGDAAGTMMVPAAPEVGSAAGDTGYFGRDGGLPGDQQEDDARSLVFETAALEHPLEVLGSARLTVRLESDRPIATLVARLCDVPPNGGVARVNYAVQNLALDENGEPSQELAPGEVRSARLTFPNCAYRFAAGHRIRLAVSSAYWPLIWAAPEPARITLHLEGAYLTLPIRREDPVPVRFREPAEAVAPASPTVLSNPPLERRTSIDAATGIGSVQWHQPFKLVRFADIDLEFGFETRADHTIALDDPGGATTAVEHRLYFRRKGWEIEVAGQARLTSTRTTYNISGSIEVRESGKLVFQREWAPVVARTCS